MEPKIKSTADINALLIELTNTLTVELTQEKMIELCPRRNKYLRQETLGSFSDSELTIEQFESCLNKAKEIGVQKINVNTCTDYDNSFESLEVEGYFYADESDEEYFARLVNEKKKHIDRAITKLNEELIGELKEYERYLKLKSKFDV